MSVCIAVPAMALGYASGFALLWQRGWSRMLHAFAPAGRMALTTYVSQTLIGITLFYGIGLGLRDRLSFAEMTIVAIAIFALQCVASRISLRSFRFGPLEWLWRRATYDTGRDAPSTTPTTPGATLANSVTIQVAAAEYRIDIQIRHPATGQDHCDAERRDTVTLLCFVAGERKPLALRVEQEARGRVLPIALEFVQVVEPQLRHDDTETRLDRAAGAHADRAEQR